MGAIRINIVIEETFEVSVEAFNLLNMTEPEKMKVAELRAALQERGLDTKGTKPVLVGRLQAALDAEKPPEEEAAMETAEETAETKSEEKVETGESSEEKTEESEGVKTETPKKE